ncbi:hypothetical protein ACH4S8_44625 [Streptomyces sp. NPDC021080]|uniref:hypothetical protein n=1 Tax=Streptomyces sp. NPDC021080 TaxID=3365110 RepID=UPI00379170BA
MTVQQTRRTTGQIVDGLADHPDRQRADQLPAENGRPAIRQTRWTTGQAMNGLADHPDGQQADELPAKSSLLADR